MATAGMVVTPSLPGQPVERCPDGGSVIWMTPDITIAIVSYNTCDLTRQAVHAALEAAAQLEAVVLVVDNGSTDGTPEAVRATFPHVQLLVNPDNPGYGAALNRAFSTLPGSYLCALNADVLLGKESLLMLRRFLDDHPECALVGPSLTYPDGTSQASCKRFQTLGFAMAELSGFHALRPYNRWHRRFYYGDRDLHGTAWVDAVSGAAMLIRGETFRRLGGFDEEFGMYFEETDLCRRLHNGGFKVAFYPDARVIHRHGASTAQTSVRQVEYYLSYIRFFRKHHGLGSARILATAVTVSTVGRMLALPLKYPPLSRQGVAALGYKMAACRRLLGALRRSASGHGRVELRVEL